MPNQRVFDFPTIPFGDTARRVNALLVTAITMDAAGPAYLGNFRVNLYCGDSSDFTAYFATSEEAQAFFDLWSQRVEDAK